MVSLLAFLAASVGAVLISWSFLLYPHEERSIAEALAAWWIRVDDAGKSSAVRGRVIIKDVATALASWLTDVFGEPLMTGRAIAISVCLSFSSICGYAGIIALVDPTPDPNNPKIVAVSFPLSYGLYAAAIGKHRRLRAGIAAALAAGIVTLTAAAMLINPHPLRGLTFLVSILVAVICDFLVIVLARRLVSTASTVAAPSALGLAAVGLLIGALMLGIPAVVIYNDGANFDTWAAIGFLAGMSNLFAGLAAVALGTLSLIFLLQRILWASVARPLYALDRFGVFTNRKALFSSGVLLIAVGFPRLASALLQALSFF